MLLREGWLLNRLNHPFILVSFEERGGEEAQSKKILTICPVIPESPGIPFGVWAREGSKEIEKSCLGGWVGAVWVGDCRSWRITGNSSQYCEELLYDYYIDKEVIQGIKVHINS